MSLSPHLSSRRHGTRGLGFTAALAMTLLVFAHAVGDGLARAAYAAAPRLDVHYVPTPDEVVALMLEMADVQPEDYVVDLGSGDGRIPIAAVRDRNARAGFGIDLDPQRVTEARFNARVAGVDDRVSFEEGDLFEKDFSDATVLTMYLLQSINLRLRPVILERMTPGTRVVSHAFNMDDWKPDAHDSVDGRNVYMWIVPARVAGDWQLTAPDGSEIRLSLTQQYQNIEGSAVVNGAQTALSDASLRGDEIRFAIGPDRYVGRVEASAQASNWHARRI